MSLIKKLRVLEGGREATNPADVACASGRKKEAEKCIEPSANRTERIHSRQPCEKVHRIVCWLPLSCSFSESLYSNVGDIEKWNPTRPPSPPPPPPTEPRMVNDAFPHPGQRNIRKEECTYGGGWAAAGGHGRGRWRSGSSESSSSLVLLRFHLASAAGISLESEQRTAISENSFPMLKREIVGRTVGLGRRRGPGEGLRATCERRPTESSSPDAVRADGQITDGPVPVPPSLPHPLQHPSPTSSDPLRARSVGKSEGAEPRHIIRRGLDRFPNCGRGRRSERADWWTAHSIVRQPFSICLIKSN